MNRVLKIIHRKQGTLGSASVVLMAMVIISALFGLVRYRIMNDRFLPDQTGIFLAAFRLPNLLFELLAMGGVSAAFIPIYTKYINVNSNEEGFKLASFVINWAMVIVFLLSMPIFIWTEPISRIMAPGFNDLQINQMSDFTRFMIFFQVMPLVLGNFLTGILQSHRLFIIPAIAPILYNIGIIIGILLFSSGIGIFSAVIGVAIGAALFVIIQIPTLYFIGYRHIIKLNISHQGVRDTGRLMLPRIIGMGASQIDSTVDLALASFIGPKAITAFFLAQSLQQVPIRLFATTISQAALPSLSHLTASSDLELLKKSIIQAFELVAFFVLPISMFLIVLRIPVVRIIFGASLFDWEATVMTALTLSMFGFSLIAQSGTQLFRRVYYALYNTKIPMFISFSSIIVNIICSVYFLWVVKLPSWALGMSTSIARWVNVILLVLVLVNKFKIFSLFELIKEPIKMFVASVISTISVYVLLKLLDQLVIDTTRVFGLVVLTIISSAIGGMIYLFISWVLGIGQFKSMLNIFKKFRQLKFFFYEPAGDLVPDDFSSK